MPRGVRKNKEIELTGVRAKIRDAEKALQTGSRESVPVSDADLERVADLIGSLGLTKTQILQKAVRIGLDAISYDGGAGNVALPFVDGKPMVVLPNNFEVGELVEIVESAPTEPQAQEVLDF